MLTSAICLVALAQGGLTLPALFSDNMVLQRGIPVPVWGSAQPGQAVSVEVAGQKASSVAGDDGKWIVRLKPMKAGGPFTMTVRGATTRTIKNVLVGEVWVASGQSNMEFWLVGSVNGAAEVAGSTDPMLRMFTVYRLSADKPANDVGGAWDVSGPEKSQSFSAVGYFFARELRRRLNVPVGVIHTSWGGTPAESWTSREVLRSDPELKHMVDRYEAGLQNMDQAKAAYEKARQDREAELTALVTHGKGIDEGWAGSNYDDTDWGKAHPPEDVDVSLGRPFDGVFWLRRTLDIPASWAGKSAVVEMPPVDDYDVTFFNGVEIGKSGPEVANSWQTPRKYTIPAGLVKAGRNVIAIRVLDTAETGGVIGDPAAFRLVCGDSTLPLAGTWKLKVETPLNLKPLPSLPMAPGDSWVPGGLYNGMIAPLIPYAIRGAIWYQGESNADRAFQYRHLFPTMIENWRKAWGQGDFPFYFVQLANFTALATTPVDDFWAELREAQTMTLSLKNTGMAVAIDVGNATDIHPKDKQTVGLRLALNAFARIYRQKVEYAGPTYKSVSFEGAQATVFFTHADGLQAKDGKVVGFALAGADHRFYWAEGRIVGKTVVLTCAQVAKPVAVRYGWSANPPVSLYNGAGLPASPFRTDTWPGVTDKNK